jgi:hypothetical protein
VKTRNSGNISDVGSRDNRWPQRWRLLIDCVLFVGVAGVVVLVVGGMGDCGTAVSNDQLAECHAFTRWKVVACTVVACIVFTFWLRRKLRRENGS